MGNGVTCKYCGKQDTDHHDNPLQLEIITKEEAIVRRNSKTSSQPQEFVCDNYTPDIKPGELVCTCNHKNKKKWCNGGCNFQKAERIDDYDD